MRKQCVLFFFLACVGLSLAACGGSSSSSSAADAGPDRGVIFSGVPLAEDPSDVKSQLSGVFGSGVDECASIGGDLCMKGGSVEIYNKTAYDAAITSNTTPPEPLLTISDEADGPGGDLKLYSNGFLLAELPTRENLDGLSDEEKQGYSDFLDGLSQQVPYYQPTDLLTPPGEVDITYTDNGIDYDFTGTIEHKQLFTTFTKSENLVLAHSTFGAWGLRVNYDGTSSDPKRPTMIGSEMYYIPFYGGNDEKKVAPASATYTGTAIGLATTGGAEKRLEAYLIGTATLKVSSHSNLELSFPQFYDFKIAGIPLPNGTDPMVLNKDGIVAAHGLGTDIIEAKRHNDNNTGIEIDFSGNAHVEVETQFYGNGGIASEGAGKFYLWGFNPQTQSGATVTGSFGLKKYQ